MANAELTAQDLSGVTVETFDGYSATRTLVDEVGEFVGSTLVLNSETTLKAYFVPAEGVDISDLTFTAVLGNEAVTVKRLEEMSDGRYVLVIENIPAQHLNDKYTITVTDGSNSGTFSMAALDYCGNVIRKAASENAETNYPQYTEALIHLLKSMYLYNQAAEAYFN